MGAQMRVVSENLFLESEVLHPLPAGTLCILNRGDFTVWCDNTEHNKDKLGNAEKGAPIFSLEERKSNLIRVLTSFGVGYIHVSAFGREYDDEKPF
jgi:hypothetical protein